MDEWDADDYCRELAPEVNSFPQFMKEEYEDVVSYLSEVAPTLAEWTLYIAAVAGPSLDCLAVLLESGCRSPWICTAAAHVKNVQAFRMAERQGCPFGIWTIFVATCTDNTDLLHEFYQLALYENLLPGDCDPLHTIMWMSTYCAASRGYTACLQMLLNGQIPMR